jgi:hypothetical protein
MKKYLPALAAGLTLGVAAMWLTAPCALGAEPAKPDAPAEKPADKPAEKPAEKPKENPLHLNAAKREKTGVTLTHPSSITLAPEVAAFGRVLDPTPLIVLVAEVETARAALAASEADEARARKLFESGANASAQVAEAAHAAAARDRAAVASARARLLANWGRALADGTALATIVSELEKGAALVRLDLLPGDVPAGDLKKASVSLIGGSEKFAADVVSMAPAADPQLQGLSFLAFVDGHALPAGAALRATLPAPGEPETVLAVPRTAIVYHQGSTWIYTLGEEDTFERKIVTLGRTVGEKVVITTGVEADEQVAATGAGQLLSAELQAGGAPDEG